MKYTHLMKETISDYNTEKVIELESELNSLMDRIEDIDIKKELDKDNIIQKYFLLKVVAQANFSIQTRELLSIAVGKIEKLEGRTE